MYNPLRYTLEYDNIKRALSEKGRVTVTGISDSARAWVAQAMSFDAGDCWNLFVVSDEQRGKLLLRDLQAVSENAWYFPCKDFLFYQADTQGTLLTRQRVELIRHILEDKRGVVVAPIDALMDKIISKKEFSEKALSIKSGSALEIAALRYKLSRMGYKRLPSVEAMGEFSVRGGIIDVFPFSYENPIRIEFWDDEVDNLRSFELISQRSIGNLENVKIYPVRESFEKEHDLNGKKIKGEIFKEQDFKGNGLRGKEVSLLDYFSENSLFFLDEPDHLLRRAISVDKEFTESFLRRMGIENIASESLDPESPDFEGTASENLASEKIIYSADNIFTRLISGRYIAFSSLGNTFSALDFQKKASYESKNSNDNKISYESKASYENEVVNSNKSVKINEAVNINEAIDIIDMNMSEPTGYKNSFKLLLHDLKKWQSEKYEVILLSASSTRASRLAQNLRDYDLRAFCPDENENGEGGRNGNIEGHTPWKLKAVSDTSELHRTLVKENQGAIQVRYGYLHKGFIYDAEKLSVLTEADMFGNAGEIKKRRLRRKIEGQKIHRLDELSPGDYVVHESHGIGIYRGIERITTEGITKDYIKIEYRDGGNLYLPAGRLSGIQKYQNVEGRAPRLNRLSGNEWQRARSRVQKAVKEIARELVALYAARQSYSGFRFGKDTVWQKEFEEMFPYEETADQVLAIEATKADMESGKIMDRLICGDVGYGKTEIALRAAFKAVQDSRQVAYLVPTTILAQQIYNTFVERMKGFPVNIALLCRFRTADENRKVVKDLKTGRVDVVVGTHRLLSKDVSFKNLGLLVIDEEQRFGVVHKEKIKNLKNEVDVLTLTATPIPRTLHMSLVGIRDMSVLEEPPIDRIPIQTYVMEYDDELVREAIQRELSRNGQVFFVHNRIHNIEEIASRIEALVPEARVAVAHGQMPESVLEQIMLNFIQGEIDVLVSTTIIETGLDIPNVNTLIVRDADRMGLSQLYQLRGRVGRSNRTAYAFFMYRKDKILTEESEKRLKAIKEFTALGSGIRIAMRDLEIRGAGNVLGAEQHGHMEAVGYELYSKLLREAVLREKGEPDERAPFETQVDCDIDAYIPDSYISNETQKLNAYRRISEISTEEDFQDIQDELIDRYGEFPTEVRLLMIVARLKALAERCYVTEIHVGRGEYRILFTPDADIHVERIPEIVRLLGGQLRVSGGKSPMLMFKLRDKMSWNVEKTIDAAKELLKRLCKKE